jgi:hypothetical protein
MIFVLVIRIFVIKIRILVVSGPIALIRIGRNIVSMMWQSCAFKLVSVRSFIETRLLMFKENPVGTFIALSHWHTALFSSLVRL